jgi:hypothetical protein
LLLPKMVSSKSSASVQYLQGTSKLELKWRALPILLYRHHMKVLLHLHCLRL